MLRIDHHLPHYQFAERHALRVTASPQQLLDAAQQKDVADDPWVKRLIAVREMPARWGAGWGLRAAKAQRAAPFGLDDFTPLERDGNRELVYGLAGRFWQSDYGLVRLRGAQDFASLDLPGVARLALNFSVAQTDQGQTLTTQTRVFCPDDESLRRFRPYWLLIRPASGFNRRRLLQRIARAALSA